jgi:hypothetical protein
MLGHRGQHHDGQPAPTREAPAAAPVPASAPASAPVPAAALAPAPHPRSPVRKVSIEQVFAFLVSV